MLPRRQGPRETQDLGPVKRAKVGDETKWAMCGVPIQRRKLSHQR